MEKTKADRKVVGMVEITRYETHGRKWVTRKVVHWVRKDDEHGAEDTAGSEERE